MTHPELVLDALAERLVVPYYMRLLAGGLHPFFASDVAKLRLAIKDLKGY